MIAGVFVRPLRQIRDRRGKVMHMLRRDDPAFVRFGEIYFSTVRPGVIKGWHLHKKMTLNYAVVSGRIRMALYDARRGSRTFGKAQEIAAGDGEGEYALITVPPGVWNGFMGLSTRPAVVANCATIPHDPAEIIRIPPRSPEIPYMWKSWRRVRR